MNSQWLESNKFIIRRLFVTKTLKQQENKKNIKNFKLGLHSYEGASPRQARHQQSDPLGPQPDVSSPQTIGFRFQHLCIQFPPVGKHSVGSVRSFPTPSDDRPSRNDWRNSTANQSSTTSDLQHTPSLTSGTKIRLHHLPPLCSSTTRTDCVCQSTVGQINSEGSSRTSPKHLRFPLSQQFFYGGQQPPTIISTQEDKAHQIPASFNNPSPRRIFLHHQLKSFGFDRTPSMHPQHLTSTEQNSNRQDSTRCAYTHHLGREYAWGRTNNY